MTSVGSYDTWCPGPTLESARRHGRSVVLPLPARLCIFLWVHFVVILVSCPTWFRSCSCWCMWICLPFSVKNGWSFWNQATKVVFALASFSLLKSSFHGMYIFPCTYLSPQNSTLMICFFPTQLLRFSVLPPGVSDLRCCNRPRCRALPKGPLQLGNAIRCAPRDYGLRADERQLW